MNDTEKLQKLADENKDNFDIESGLTEKNKDKGNKETHYSTDELKLLLFGIKKFDVYTKIEGYTLLPDRILYPLLQSNLTKNEIKVFLYIFKQTIGYKRIDTAIDWKKIITGTGIDKSKIYKCMKALKDYNMISYDDKNRNKIKMIINPLQWKDEKKNSFQKGIDFFLNIKCLNITKEMMKSKVKV